MHYACSSCAVACSSDIVDTVGGDVLHSRVLRHVEARQMDPSTPDWFISTHLSVEWAIGTSSVPDRVVPTLTTAHATGFYLGSRGRYMRIREQARCLGFVSAEMIWPDPSAAMRLMGNTWPLNVIAQLVQPLLRAMDFDWLHSDSWTRSDHADRLLADAEAH